MGASDVVKEVEDRLPGVRFRVDKWERLKRSGYITLRCEVNDPALFDTCVVKLDGLKIFTGDLVEEVLGALGDALTGKEEELQNKEQEVTQLKQELATTQAELVKLRRLMHSVGVQLGIEDA